MAGTRRRVASGARPAVSAPPSCRSGSARARGARMILALETATDRASCAGGRSEAEAVETSVSGARRHAASLLPMVNAVLDKAGAGIDDLTAVVVADGPGSFTGLRVGAAVAKALVQSRGLGLWTAPSLLVRA